MKRFVVCHDAYNGWHVYDVLMQCAYVRCRNSDHARIVADQLNND